MVRRPLAAAHLDRRGADERQPDVDPAPRGAGAVAERARAAGGGERGGAGGADARAGGGPGRLHLHAAQPRVPRAEARPQAPAHLRVRGLPERRGVPPADQGGDAAAPALEDARRRRLAGHQGPHLAHVPTGKVPTHPCPQVASAPPARPPARASCARAPAARRRPACRRPPADAPPPALRVRALPSPCAPRRPPADAHNHTATSL